MIIKSEALSIYEMGKRQNQEDSIFPGEAANCISSDVYILCDGMGGHDRGEVASGTVCKVIGEYVLSHTREDGFFDEDDFKAALNAAYDKLDGLDNPASEKKMGTTLTFLKFHKGGAFIAHIGDSRIYHFRPDGRKILSVTKDHSLVNELIAIGELTVEEAKTSGQKNIITRAVQPNQGRRVMADCLNIEDVRAGDYFYLCSDGMLEISTDEEIANVVCMDGKTDAEKIKILRSVTKDNSDNHTAYLVHIKSVVPEDRDDAFDGFLLKDENMSENAVNVENEEDGSGVVHKLLFSLCFLCVLAVTLFVGMRFLKSHKSGMKGFKVESTVTKTGKTGAGKNAGNKKSEIACKKDTVAYRDVQNDFLPE